MRDHSILNRAAKRGLSRREFIQAALALGMSVPATGLLWSQSARAEAKQGGHFRLGLAGGATTDSLDPSTYTDTFMVMIGYTVRGNLVEVAADGSAVPEVAESFEGPFSMPSTPPRPASISRWCAYRTTATGTRCG